MGIKMKKAWWKSKNIEIKTDEATDKMRKDKDLKCFTEFCDAQVTWVERHRKVSDTNTRFFRLLPKEKHSLKCRYNTKGRVEAIAKKSDKKIIVNLVNGNYEFRLNLVTDELKDDKSKVNNIKEEKSTKNDNDKKDKKIVSKGKIKPYLSLMKDIMTLRSEVESDDDLKSLLKITFNRVKIAWKNFYIELDDVEKLYKYIDYKGYKSNAFKRLNHPICVEFQINNKSIKKIKDVYYINAKQRKYVKPNINMESNIYNLTLKTTNQDIIDEINDTLNKNGNTYLDFASYFMPYINETPKEYINDKGAKDIILIYHTVEGWINYNEQITTI